MSVQLQLCPDIMSEHLKKVIGRTVRMYSTLPFFVLCIASLTRARYTHSSLCIASLTRARYTHSSVVFCFVPCISDECHHNYGV